MVLKKVNLRKRWQKEESQSKGRRSTVEKVSCSETEIIFDISKIGHLYNGGFLLMSTTRIYFVFPFIIKFTIVPSTIKKRKQHSKGFH